MTRCDRTDFFAFYANCSFGGEMGRPTSRRPSTCPANRSSKGGDSNPTFPAHGRITAMLRQTGRRTRIDLRDLNSPLPTPLNNMAIGLPPRDGGHGVPRTIPASVRPSVAIPLGQRHLEVGRPATDALHLPMFAASPNEHVVPPAILGRLARVTGEQRGVGIGRLCRRLNVLRTRKGETCLVPAAA